MKWVVVDVATKRAESKHARDGNLYILERAEADARRIAELTPGTVVLPSFVFVAVAQGLLDGTWRIEKRGEVDASLKPRW